MRVTKAIVTGSSAIWAALKTVHGDPLSVIALP
jgi:hypothetical protein